MKIRGSLARIPGPQLLSRLRDLRRAAVVVWVSAALACSADGTGIFGSGTLSIALSRDSVLTVGRDSTAWLTVDVRGADGTRTPISEENTLIVYTISDTSVVEFANPYYAFASRQLHPKKSGVASITVTADGMSSTTSVRVVDDRPVVTPELGTVVQGVVKDGIGAVRYAFDLRAGDTVDMRAERAYSTSRRRTPPSRYHKRRGMNSTASSVCRAYAEAAST